MNANKSSKIFDQQILHIYLYFIEGIDSGPAFELQIMNSI